MNLTVADIMQQKVLSVGPGLSLKELERRFLQSRKSGFPVLEDGRLIGIVTRSDVIRQLCVERSRAGMLADLFVDATVTESSDRKFGSVDELQSYLGRRMESLCVNDVMMSPVFTLSPEQPVQDIAKLFVDRGIHRAPVVKAEQMLGFVTTLDLVRLVADGRIAVTD